MTIVMSVKVDHATKSQLIELSRKLCITRSAVVRQGVNEIFDKHLQKESKKHVSPERGSAGGAGGKA